METLVQDLKTANEFVRFSDEWTGESTDDGGWALRLTGSDAVIKYSRAPGSAVSEPYQVDLRGVASFASLNEALGYVWRRL